MCLATGVAEVGRIERLFRKKLNVSAISLKLLAFLGYCAGALERTRSQFFPSGDMYSGSYWRDAGSRVLAARLDSRLVVLDAFVVILMFTMVDIVFPKRRLVVTPGEIAAPIAVTASAFLASSDARFVQALLTSFPQTAPAACTGVAAAEVILLRGVGGAAVALFAGAALARRVLRFAVERIVGRAFRFHDSNRSLALSFEEAADAVRSLQRIFAFLCVPVTRFTDAKVLRLMQMVGATCIWGVGGGQGREKGIRFQLFDKYNRPCLTLPAFLLTCD